MAFDAARGEVVLFGGRSNGTFLDDTWTFGGSSWAQQVPTTVPPARAYAAMAFAAERSRVVLHSGLDTNFACLADTWEWDGSDWLAAAPATPPTARYAGVLAHHAAMDTTLLLGGSNLAADLPESVLYASPITATYAPHGVGCPGPWGTTSLQPAAHQRPWLGDVFELQFDNLPQQPGALIVIFGFTDVAWQGNPLPVPLDIYGMPGCSVWMSVDDPFFAFHQGGSLRFPFPLPMTPGLAGLAYYNQAIVVDPSVANPLGAVMTNAGRARIGLR